ncbi:hypothetical protein K505DRAFT_340155 [Melanomma pulvis-pyrius CBS 109.77]|uniref:Uncharacterized protein n=1 Tax=Melanomma pulvis-pyrius CBS 109.77 TaxID=1314802 RepID=A0A6A6X3E7_9PLEO|nr:hypothetical protein K505DRAFT_340155 [Melanomma pulvis-pyrius CBS 109.77]
MSVEPAKHMSLTQEIKLREAVYLAWWKQKLNNAQDAEDDESIDWNNENSADRNWDRVKIPDSAIMEKLDEARKNGYAASVVELGQYARDLNATEGVPSKDMMMKFSALAFSVAIEEFDSIDGVVAKDVFDLSSLWDEFHAYYEGNKSIESKYRYA